MAKILGASKVTVRYQVTIPEDVRKQMKFHVRQYLLVRVFNQKGGALEGNRTPVRGSTVPYTGHCTTRATKDDPFQSSNNRNAIAS